MSPQTPRRLSTSWVGAVLLLLAALAFFVWSGSASDPRAAAPWRWAAGGWLVPAPGIGALWIAATCVLALLSRIAWLLLNPAAGAKTLKPWASALIILGLAIGVRVLIVRTWTPLLLDAAGIHGTLQDSLRGRALAIAADAAVVGLLLLALAGARRSLWWAVLYALHPLPLLELAGNGHLVVLALLLLLLLVGLAHRFGHPVRMGIVAAVAAACVVATAAGCRQSPFNSLAFELAWALRVPAIVVLPLVETLAQAVVLLIAWRRRWSLALALLHILLLFLIFSPVVEPWYVLAPLALLPLAWAPAGWVLSIVALGAYMVVPIVRGHGQWRIPEWWLVIEWLPVIVLEAQDLISALRRHARLSSPAALRPSADAGA